ncbi:MAG: AraC family transcriptional regulator [Bacillota bacterium]
MDGKERNEFGRSQSIFGKIVFSYGVVVVIVTVILGAVSYLFFTSRYNREIEKVHQKALEQVADTLRFRVIQPVTRSFLDLSSYYSDPSANLLHFDEQLAGNNYKIYQTYDYLKQAVAIHSGLVGAIHIYYKKQNLIISSSLGVGFLNRKDRNSYKYLDWIHSVKANLRSIWLEPCKAYFHPAQSRKITKNNVFTFIRTFPIIATRTDCQGLIAIDISEAALSNLIDATIPAQYQQTFLINEQGRIISHPQKKLLFRRLNQESYIRRILNSPLTFNSFIHKINRHRLMVSFTSLPNTKWKIVNMIPIDQFYQNTHFIQILLIVICCVAILIGILLSFIFTRRIYNPLALIIQKVLLLTSASGSAPTEDEFGFINRFIDEVAVKVHSLRETGPALQNNLIMGLLYHRFLSEGEQSEELQLLEDSFRFPYYYVVLFQMDETTIKNRTLEESQTIKNQLNLEIRKIDDHFGKCLGIDLSGGKIGVIAGVQEVDSVLINRLVEKVIAAALNNYQLPVTATAGSGVSSWLEIHRSFQEAVLLQKYRYFYPGLPLIRGEAFLKKERSQATLPAAPTADFADGLRRRDLKQIEAALARLIATITAGDYSAHYCQQVIWEITHIFSMYLKDMRYSLSESERSGLENLWLTTGNIQGFKAWICGFAGKVFNWTATRTGNRNYETIAKVVQYLAAHLEADLSLEAAAELVNLSPGYFSKVFKKATGAAFSVYLTNLRIKKARQLLLKTNLSVQEIGYQVGYNAPAYFIKQFKAKSGYTPYDYRRQFRDRNAFEPQEIPLRADS